MNTRTPTVTYRETDEERVIACRSQNRTIEIAQPFTGYGMLSVRTPEGEVERYYALDMAIDHVTELLEVDAIDIPEAAADMGI